jgi:hypothetical protein
VGRAISVGAGAVGAAVAFSGLGGCVEARPAAAMRVVVPVATSGADERAALIGLDEGIRGALEDIAVTDPRFARRLAAPPSEDALRAAAVKALAEGDPDVSIRDGALDSFSFTARGRGLDKAEKDVGRSPELPDSAGERVLTPRPHLERELAVRVVAEERARLEEERSLPRGASALVRGIVETWTPPASPRIAAERDEWLANRLDQVRASLAGSRLPRSALLELDDALDPLERLTPADELPSSARALAGLRVALGETQPAPGGTDDGRRARVEAGVRAHLGLSLGAREVRMRLEQAEVATRALAKGAAAGPRAGDERALAKRAEELTLAAGKCEASPAVSRVRSVAPPSERAPICGLLHALHDASDDASRAAALVALHDSTVVGLWALALHAEGSTPERVFASVHPFYGAQPEREARLVRFAEASPVAAIGAGLAADLLVRNGSGPSASANAEALAAASGRWLSFGDAPLDVIEREVFAPPSPLASASPSVAPPTSAPGPVAPRP